MRRPMRKKGYYMQGIRPDMLVSSAETLALAAEHTITLRLPVIEDEHPLQLRKGAIADSGRCFISYTRPGKVRARGSTG